MSSLFIHSKECFWYCFVVNIVECPSWHSCWAQKGCYMFSQALPLLKWKKEFWRIPPTSLGYFRCLLFSFWITLVSYGDWFIEDHSIFFFFLHCDMKHSKGNTLWRKLYSFRLWQLEVIHIAVWRLLKKKSMLCAKQIWQNINVKACWLINILFFLRQNIVLFLWSN